VTVRIPSNEEPNPHKSTNDLRFIKQEQKKQN
jgi:hypothetical protein